MIVLVVTILVIIILATISIRMSLKKGGVIQRAFDTVKEGENSTQREEERYNGLSDNLLEDMLEYEE